MMKTMLRSLVLTLALAVLGFMFAGTATAATPSKTKTVTTWNVAHTIKNTDSFTTRATGTTHTVTVTKYLPKVKGQAQVKLSAHKVSDSISTNSKGERTHKRTVTDTTYYANGEIKKEIKNVEVM